jgi:DNA uptake protein ComE-like DNA-binding protein
MKHQITNLIKTYFYFNKQEQRGFIALILVVAVLTVATFVYTYIFPAKPVEFKVETVNMALLTDSVTQTHKNKTILFTRNNKQTFKKFAADSIKQKKPKPLLNINTADSVQLVALYRIGPVMASKIIQYRDKLGGFHNLNQLTEIWGFDADILYDLEGKIYVNPNNIKLLNLNTVEFDELKQHPYFKFKLSQAIVNYRKQHGNYQNITDLKQIKFVTDSIINLIKPYVILE